jgi:hypothetical protein
MSSDRSVFIVRLRPEPYVAEPMNLLRWALKRLGRAGFKCLAVTIEPPPDPTPEHNSGPGSSDS